MADLGLIGQQGNLVFSKPDQSAAVSSKWSFADAHRGNLAFPREDQSASVTSEWFFFDAEHGNLVFPKAQSAGTSSAFGPVVGERGNLTFGSTPPMLAFIAEQGLLTFNRLEQSPPAIPSYLTPIAQQGLLTFFSVKGKAQSGLTPNPKNILIDFLEDIGEIDDPGDVPSGITYGVLLREELADDTNEQLLPYDDPVLVSGDMIYGNLDVVKETDSIAPNASWSHGEQLAVLVNARDYLSNPVDWLEQDAAVGNWKPTLQEGKLTFTDKKRFGRVLRYRFVGTNLRGLKFDAYSVNVYAQGAQR